jgi:hypothetical protein
VKSLERFVIEVRQLHRKTSDNSPISEHIGEAEDLVVAQRVEVEEVRHVDVLHAELVGFAAVVSTARQVIVDFDALHFEANVAVLDAAIEFRVAVDEVDGSDVVGDEREDLLLCLLVNESCSIGIVVLEEGGRSDGEG